jgi:hypothetical protein
LEIASRSCATMRFSAWPRRSLSERGATATVRSPAATFSVASLMPRMSPTMPSMARIRSPISSCAEDFASTSRSPCATARTTATALLRLRLIERPSQAATARPSASATPARISTVSVTLAPASSAMARPASMSARNPAFIVASFSSVAEKATAPAP